MWEPRCLTTLRAFTPVTGRVLPYPLPYHSFNPQHTLRAVFILRLLQVTLAFPCRVTCSEITETHFVTHHAIIECKCVTLLKTCGIYIFTVTTIATFFLQRKWWGNILAWARTLTRSSKINIFLKAVSLWGTSRLFSSLLRGKVRPAERRVFAVIHVLHVMQYCDLRFQHFDVTLLH
jgi:hypothetical protein